jgi:hypothetical protein
LPLLRVFPEEADELDVIEIHDLILLFLPHFLGAPEGGVDTAPKASGCILGGTPKDSQGGTGKAEDVKLPGAGIIPKPCPRKGGRKLENKPDVLSTAIQHRGRRGCRRGMDLTGCDGKWPEPVETHGQL